MKIKISICVIFLLVTTVSPYSQWVHCDSIPGGIVNSLAISGNNIFLGSLNNGVYISTNNGSNWNQTSLDSLTIHSIATSGNNIFCGTDSNGVYISTNNGLNWLQTSLNNQKVLSLAINGNYIFAGTYYNGVYISTNNGLSWVQSYLNNQQILSFVINGNNIFAGTGGIGVCLSTNNGLNWVQTSLNNEDVFSLALNSNTIFAGTYSNGVYISTNNGLSWAHTSLINRDIYSLAVSGSNIFAGSNSNGIYITTNNGLSWVQRNEGFPFYISIESFCIINNYIIAGSAGYSVWRRYIPELIGIKKNSNVIPERFELSQNYPNPFNPSTQIQFSVPKNKTHIVLNIFDISGKEIQKLVDEELSAGKYKVEFDGSSYASGIYFFRLETKDFIETKKMVLVR